MEAILPARSQTRQVRVGDVTLGGGAPVRVQSMCTTDTADATATLAQIERLATLGCEIIRVALPSHDVLAGFREICAASPLPVVADIHFDSTLALAALRAGAAAVRINPGNIGAWDKVEAILDAAGEVGAPVRIGVNAGSLEKGIAARDDLSLVEKLVASAEAFVTHAHERGFYDIVLSAKAHDVPTTIATYTALARLLPKVPLHLGVTEAGTAFQGTIKSSIALGSLLEAGIGDTLRVSLTADPAEEIRVAWEILAACGLRRRGPELVSCPTCGRTQVDLIPIAEEVERRLAAYSTPITVAVMGCVVNGPGEAAGADIGVACGHGTGAIFAGGEVVRRVDEAEIVDALFREIDARFGEARYTAQEL